MGHNVGLRPHLVTTKLLGLTQYAYSLAGIALPRTPRQQSDAVSHVGRPWVRVTPRPPPPYRCRRHEREGPDVSSRVSRHHSPRAEDGPAHQPGHDDAHRHSRRFWQQRG